MQNRGILFRERTDTTEHTHTWAKSKIDTWDGHQMCHGWYCTTCPDGARASRVTPIGQPAPHQTQQ